MAKILSHNLGIIYFLLPTTNFLALAPINNAIILLIAHKLGRGVFILQIGSWFIAQKLMFHIFKNAFDFLTHSEIPNGKPKSNFYFFFFRKEFGELCLTITVPIHIGLKNKYPNLFTFSVFTFSKNAKPADLGSHKSFRYILVHMQLFLYCSLYVRNWLFVHWPLTILYSLGYTSNK